MTFPRKVFLGLAMVLLLSAAAPSDALARRSGGSFSGGGFRTSSAPRSLGGGYRSPASGGSNFVFLPGFGWGLGGFGYGGGMSSLLMMGMLGLGAFYMMRAIGRAQTRRGPQVGDLHGDRDEDAGEDAAYVYRLQLALGRSARGLKERLAAFAAEGDTGSETGLAALLSQTTLEILREKDSIRYADFSAGGPLTLAHGETKMNGMALKERSQFQVERVRGAGGKVRRSDQQLAESPDVLEYILVTIIVAARRPIGDFKQAVTHEEIEQVLQALGGVPAHALLGLEVIWTPADDNDSLTETDLLTGHPDLRSV